MTYTHSISFYSSSCWKTTHPILFFTSSFIRAVGTAPLMHDHQYGKLSPEGAGGELVVHIAENEQVSDITVVGSDLELDVSEGLSQMMTHIIGGLISEWERFPKDLILEKMQKSDINILKKWTPYNPFSGSFASVSPGVSVDWAESHLCHMITLDLPGLKCDDFIVEFEGDFILKISGKLSSMQTERSKEQRAS